jgi:hypothetical protein
MPVWTSFHRHVLSTCQMRNSIERRVDQSREVSAIRHSPAELVSAMV